MAENSPDCFLPSFLGEMLRTQYGTDIALTIEKGYAEKRATTLRANTLLGDKDQVHGALDEVGIRWRAVPWFPEAAVLDPQSERALWDLQIFKEGKVYLQSLSSMIPPLVLGDCRGLDVLDMCAAPGGKTTELAALSGGKARITATELNVPRAEKLEYNLRKQGASNVVVMRTDARKLDDFFSFDRILLDAPCSGSGTLDAFSPKTAKRFTPTLIQKSVKSQKALLAKALRLVKPGGTVIYSTCSVLREENEDIINSTLAKANRHGSYKIEPITLNGAQLVPTAEACSNEEILSGPGSLPFLPTSLEGALALCPTSLYEGFFVAKIKRLA